MCLACACVVTAAVSCKWIINFFFSCVPGVVHLKFRFGQEPKKKTVELLYNKKMHSKLHFIGREGKKMTMQRSKNVRKNVEKFG